MSYATTASAIPSFRAPLRVGDAVVGRGKSGWTTSKRVNIPAYARTTHNASWKKKEQNLCWTVCHVPPTTQSVKGLKWTELPFFLLRGDSYRRQFNSLLLYPLLYLLVYCPWMSLLLLLYCPSFFFLLFFFLFSCTARRALVYTGGSRFISISLLGLLLLLFYARGLSNALNSHCLLLVHKRTKPRFRLHQSTAIITSSPLLEQPGSVSLHQTWISQRRCHCHPFQ